MAGVIGDIGGAVTCQTSMPNLARRFWLMSRMTNLEKVNGKWKLVNLRRGRCCRRLWRAGNLELTAC